MALYRKYQDDIWRQDEEVKKVFQKMDEFANIHSYNCLNRDEYTKKDVILLLEELDPQKENEQVQTLDEFLEKVHIFLYDYNKLDGIIVEQKRRKLQEIQTIAEDIKRRYASEKERIPVPGSEEDLWIKQYEAQQEKKKELMSALEESNNKLEKNLTKLKGIFKSSTKTIIRDVNYAEQIETWLLQVEKDQDLLSSDENLEGKIKEIKRKLKVYVGLKEYVNYLTTEDVKETYVTKSLENITDSKKRAAYERNMVVISTKLNGKKKIKKISKKEMREEKRLFAESVERLEKNLQEDMKNGMTLSLLQGYLNHTYENELKKIKDDLTYRFGKKSKNAIVTSKRCAKKLASWQERFNRYSELCVNLLNNKIVNNGNTIPVGNLNFKEMNQETFEKTMKEVSEYSKINEQMHESSKDKETLKKKISKTANKATLSKKITLLEKKQAKIFKNFLKIEQGTITSNQLAALKEQLEEQLEETNEINLETAQEILAEDKINKFTKEKTFTAIIIRAIDSLLTTKRIYDVNISYQSQLNDQNEVEKIEELNELYRNIGVYINEHNAKKSKKYKVCKEYLTSAGIIIFVSFFTTLFINDASLYLNTKKREKENNKSADAIEETLNEEYSFSGKPWISEVDSTIHSLNLENNDHDFNLQSNAQMTQVDEVETLDALDFELEEETEDFSKKVEDLTKRAIDAVDTINQAQKASAKAREEHYAEIYDDEYYGVNGNIVDKKTYQKECSVENLAENSNEEETTLLSAVSTKEEYEELFESNIEIDKDAIVSANKDELADGTSKKTTNPDVKEANPALYKLVMLREDGTTFTVGNDWDSYVEAISTGAVCIGATIINDYSYDNNENVVAYQGFYEIGKMRKLTKTEDVQ